MPERFEDHWSTQAQQYASFRPRYPDELFAYLAALAPAQDFAWDCGAGSGQAAAGLAKYFKQVLATDGSADQIAQAVAHERIIYSLARAEEVSLPPRSVDLFAAAQAVHWFDLASFYPIVRQAAKPGGVLAVWMYYLPVIAPAIDQAVREFFTDVLAGFWPERFHYLEARYRTLPFPFDEIETPNFEMQASWNLDQLAGFLDTWSAVRRYQGERGVHPLQVVWPELSKAWGQPDQPRIVRWPIDLRVGKIL